jgi:hypothetical protein
MIFSRFWDGRFLLAVACLACCLACSNSSNNSQQKPTGPRGALETIFVSGARYGQLTPCECRDNQFGGIDREAKLIAELSANKTGRLLLDAGGFTAPMFNAHEEIKAKFVLRGMGLLGIELVNVVWSDLLLGRETLVESAKENQLELLSANIVDAESGELVFKPFATFELDQGDQPGPPGAGAGRLLVIGLTVDFPEAVKTQQYYGERVERQFKVTDPKAALQRVLAEQRRPDDLVVVLVFIDWNRADDVFQGVEGVNLAFNSFHYVGESEEVMTGGVRLIASGFQGRFMQEIALGRDAAGAPRIAKVKELKVPAEHAQDPRLTAVVDDYNAEIERVFSGKEPLVSLYQLAENDNKYVGYTQCMLCHEAQVNAWRQTAHAQALQTLIGKGRSYDPDCVICHTAGFGKNGYLNFDLTPHLAGVQCDVCHGMGYLHVQERQTIMVQTIMAETQQVELDPPIHHLNKSFSSEFCIKCHDIDNDASFDFAHDVALISHLNQLTPPSQAAAETADDRTTRTQVTTKK